MAKTLDRELFDRLRAQGLRKRVARLASEAVGAGRTANARGNAGARKAITELRKAADEIEDRLRGGQSSRSTAAKKAARTRAAAATKRSTAAKKAAATRARKSSGTASTRRSSSSGTTRRRTSSGTRSTARRSS
jgi:hypothetical protein